LNNIFSNTSYLGSEFLTEYNSIKEYLTSNLSTKRFEHSVGTAKTAEKLAIIYNEDSRKAYLAGLMHDCTREIDIKDQNKMLEALGIVVDDITSNTKELLHAVTAEYLIVNEFNINDKEIISAVRFHTTGKENMTQLEKIIFLADVIEPSRNFPGIEYIRQLAESNIDEAMLTAFESSIKFLLCKRQMIHPNTLLARNYILKHFKEKK
jgi:predicted HD superfamily hydrolase involved in NAD metabolism